MKTIWMSLLWLVGCTGVLGCAASGEAVEERASFRVDLVVVGIDPVAAKNSQALRWAKTKAEAVPNEALTDRTLGPGLLDEAKSRLAVAPGQQFFQQHSVLLRSGSRATVGTLSGNGTGLDVPVRAVVAEDGAIRVDVGAHFSQTRTDEEGLYRNMRFRAPWLRYGNAPITVDGGGTGANRLTQTAGTLIRPRSMDVYVFVKASVAE